MNIDDLLAPTPRSAIDAGPSFFPMTLEQLEVESSTGREEMERWFSEGWISFAPSFSANFEEPHLAELRFVGSLLRTGMHSEWLRYVVKNLPKPYGYSPDRIVYSFAKNSWHELPHDKDDEDAARELIQRLINTDASDILHELRDLIDQAIGQS